MTKEDFFTGHQGNEKNPGTLSCPIQRMRASYGGFMDSVAMVELDPDKVQEHLATYVPYAALWGIADDLEPKQRVVNDPIEAKQDLAKTVQVNDGLLT